MKLPCGVTTAYAGAGDNGMVRSSRSPFYAAQRLSETMPDSALVKGAGGFWIRLGAFVGAGIGRVGKGTSGSNSCCGPRSASQLAGSGLRGSRGRGAVEQPATSTSAAHATMKTGFDTRPLCE